MKHFFHKSCLKTSSNTFPKINIKWFIVGLRDTNSPYNLLNKIYFFFPGMCGRRQSEHSYSRRSFHVQQLRVLISLTYQGGRRWRHHLGGWGGGEYFYCITPPCIFSECFPWMWKTCFPVLTLELACSFGGNMTVQTRWFQNIIRKYIFTIIGYRLLIA